MSRLPSLTARKLVAALKRAGFYDEGQTGSHLALSHESRPSVIVPVHCGDVNRNTMMRIIRQAGFTEEEFLKFLR